MGYVDALLEDVAATNPRLTSAKTATGLRIQVGLFIELRSISGNHNIFVSIRCGRFAGRRHSRCLQDKTLLLDNPAAPVKKKSSKRNGSQVAILSGMKLKRLGLHSFRPEEIR